MVFRSNNIRHWAIGLAIGVLALTGWLDWQQESVAYAATDVKTLQQKKQSNLQKLQRIRQLKRQIILQEKYVTSNIIHNQQRLEATRASLHQKQQLLERAKKDLKTLEADLDTVLGEQSKLSIEVGKRLRSFYMGEHLTLLHMLLDAGNVSTFLDRFYYQQRIYSQDKQLVERYRVKTVQLEKKKNALAWHKNRLSATINSIQNYQSQLQESVMLDKMLMEKLKTSKHAYDMAEDQLERESYNIQVQIQRMAGQYGPVLGSTGRFSAPVIAPIRSQFGYRVHPIYRSRRFHSGTDFGARYGSPIHAADGGKVIYSGWYGGYGKVVIINHGTISEKNVTSLYAHLSGTACRVGQNISKGQVVGYVGSTGLSTGPHLHFEVRENGKPVNPLTYLR